jgi:serine/threonine protein kinase
MTRHSFAVPLVVGRYTVYGEIAAGGMATVHFGRLQGDAGFTRIVAIKRLLPQLVQDQDFVLMLKDEARLAGRVRHPNVVSILDVAATSDELMLVMDYVHGESLGKLAHTVRALGDTVPLPIACAVIIDALHGLHAAHEARDELAKPLGLVHRDVSPQNLIVGVDGVTRVADFGIAKAAGRSQETHDGSVKGKPSYMAPEQIQRLEVTRRTDVFAAGVVFWELLAGRRLFYGSNVAQVILQILNGEVPALSAEVPELSPAFEDIVRRALAREPNDRFASARDMALAIEAVSPAVRSSEVGAWVGRVAHDSLRLRERAIASIERAPLSTEEDSYVTAPIPANALPSTQESTTVSERRVGTGASVSWARAPSGAPSTVSGPQQAVESNWRASLSAARWLFLLSAMVGLSGGVWVFGFEMKRASEAPVASVSASTSACASAVPSTQAAPDASATGKPASSGQSAAPSRVASTVAPTLASSSKKAAARATRSSGPAAPARCNPPYLIDSAGHHIFKLECI